MTFPAPAPQPAVRRLSYSVAVLFDAYRIADSVNECVLSGVTGGIPHGKAQQAIFVDEFSFCR